MYADHQCGETAWRMNLLTRSLIQLVLPECQRREPLSEMLGLPDPGAGLDREAGDQQSNIIPPYPWFCFLRFQLPVVNWGLKILEEIK